MDQGELQSQLYVGRLFQDNRKDLRLSVLAGHIGSNRIIKGKNLHFPGLALTGFMDAFPAGQVQLFGVAENAYLRSLAKPALTKTLEAFFEADVPCVIITDGCRASAVMKAIANAKGVPLICSRITQTELGYLLSLYLNERFAPSLMIHGTLVDVYGTGLLFIGRAGIGKSEIALDLIERGHRLVGDDVVRLTKRPPGILIGSGPEILRHLIEIRGLGIINVRQMFGVRSIRIQKRIETVVELTDWNEEEDYERVGVDVQYCEYIGVKIPLIRLPIYPGKNITVIAETIALNLHLMVYGESAARELIQRQKVRQRDRERIRKYLQADDE